MTVNSTRLRGAAARAPTGPAPCTAGLLTARGPRPRPAHPGRGHGAHGSSFRVLLISLGRYQNYFHPDQHCFQRQAAPQAPPQPPPRPRILTRRHSSALVAPSAVTCPHHSNPQRSHLLESSFCARLHYPARPRFDLRPEVCRPSGCSAYPHFHIIVLTQFHNGVYFSLQHAQIWDVNFILLLKRCPHAAPWARPVRRRRPGARGRVSPSGGRTEPASAGAAGWPLEPQRELVSSFPYKRRAFGSDGCDAGAQDASSGFCHSTEVRPWPGPLSPGTGLHQLGVGGWDPQT